MLELQGSQAIFVGFKLDSSLRRQIDSLSGPDQKYVSREDPSFLMVCRLGEDLYVGKVIHERLTTDRIDDVRRNVLSIMSRLCPEVRLPAQLEVLACSPADEPGVLDVD